MIRNNNSDTAQYSCPISSISSCGLTNKSLVPFRSRRTYDVLGVNMRHGNFLTVARAYYPMKVLLFSCDK